MTNFLSSVSGQFNKALILGAFFPTALFVVLGWLFLIPLFPTQWARLDALAALDPQWQLATATLLTIILSGVLYNLNIPIIRFYEGYPWMDTRFGKRRRDHYARERGASKARFKQLMVLGGAFPQNPQRESITHEWNAELRKLNNMWPTTFSLLPTRLGNVIRSFEEYPWRQYRIDAVALWPRLIAKIDEKCAVAIDSAKIPFDFMLNASVLSITLSLAIAVVGLLYPARLAYGDMWQSYVPWLLEIAIFAGLTVLFYHASVARAGAWGETVKAAFDLYKADLLTQMGYKWDTTGREDERAVWRSISLQTIYGDAPLGGPRLDYDPPLAPPSPPDPATFAQAGGDRNNLQVARGVQQPVGEEATLVAVLVKNTSQADDLQDVVVTDTVSAGFDYLWGSAKVGQQVVPVEGINPYQFRVGGLAHGVEKTLTYRIVPRKVCK